jgi:hypothetical protein
VNLCDVLFLKRFRKYLCNFSSFFEGYTCASAIVHGGAIACVDAIAPCVVIFIRV